MHTSLVDTPIRQEDVVTSTNTTPPITRTGGRDEYAPRLGALTRWVYAWSPNLISAEYVALGGGEFRVAVTGTVRELARLAAVAVPDAVVHVSWSSLETCRIRVVGVLDGCPLAVVLTVTSDSPVYEAVGRHFDWVPVSVSVAQLHELAGVVA